MIIQVLPRGNIFEYSTQSYIKDMGKNRLMYIFFMYRLFLSVWYGIVFGQMAVFDLYIVWKVPI